MGPAMMQDFRRQAERFGAEFVTDDVTRVDFSERPFRIWVDKDEYQARSVIVATGASARWLGLDSEQRLQGRGVSACATCDGAFFKEKRIVVVGGGDSAFEEALFLTRFGTKVTLVHRRNDFRASQIMVSRALANPKIELLTPYAVEEVLGETMVSGLRLRNTDTGELRDVEAEGLLRSDRPRPEHEALRRPARPRRERLPDHPAGQHRDERSRRLRRRRRPGSHLPPGDHRCGLRMYGCTRRRAVPRGARDGERQDARRVAIQPPKVAL